MDASALRRLRRNLIAWYADHARDLPWRRTCDPYRVWISEIMLQQTTVAAVVPYFERFLARFPDVESLAAADEQDVLRLWEGLGYYSRARNIHKTARTLVDQSGGRFPDDVPTLAALPGIGRYTAGAIASFAFDRRAPIVEANTMRLYSRLLGYRDDPRAAAGQQTLWAFAERVLPGSYPGRFNQALMELGATVCTPSDPRCESCPVRSSCAAFAGGLQREIPVAAKRPEITEVIHAAVAVEREGRWLVRRCGPDERWAGLWDFPRVELSGFGEGGLPGPDSGGPSSSDRRSPASGSRLNETLSAAVRSEIELKVERLTGLGVHLGPIFHQLRHSVTRYRIHLLCCRAACRSDSQPGNVGASLDQSGLMWAQTDELSELPLSVTGRKLANALPNRPA